jgi:predicted lipid-binding transport protein (Tim44 family)
MKTWLIGALVLSLATALAPLDADAKRLGGGRSSGMQRDMPARTAPDAPPAKPAAPQQGAAPATAGAAAAAPGAAVAGKRSWLGPIAGIAAGLGLVALMSHLGLGAEFANFLMLALLVVGVIALVAFIRRRMAGGAARTPALAGSGVGGAARSTQVAWPQPLARNAPLERTALDPAPDARAANAAQATVTQAFVPASFDSEAFERIAKMIFIRMQAANDSAHLDDLRQFTTPEVFASLKLDLLDRGSSAQHTEVKSVQAQVLDVADEAGRQVVSVRYRGEVVEAAGAAPVAFDEVWHLLRQGEGAWLIAGIEQMA